MSQENVEFHHQVIDAFNRRDLGAYLALIDPEWSGPRTRFGCRGASLTGAMPVSEAGGKSLLGSSRTSGQRSTRYETSETGRSRADAFAGRAREAARRLSVRCGWPTNGVTRRWCGGVRSGARPRPSKPPESRSRRCRGERGDRRASLDAFDRRDLDAFLALMDDDVEAVPRMGAMEGRQLSRPRESAAGGKLARRLSRLQHRGCRVRDLGDLTSQPCSFAATARVAARGRAEMIGEVQGRRGKVRPVGVLRHAGPSPRSRGAVGARRSRRLLSWELHSSCCNFDIGAGRLSPPLPLLLSVAPIRTDNR